MKKFLKIVFFTFLIVVVGIGGYWAFHKFIVKHDNRTALSVIPKDAIFVAETSDLSKAWTEISNSKVWNFLTQNAYFKDINADIEMLNSFLKNNKFADLMLNNRELMLSAHMISGTDWDMLYVVDLKDAASSMLNNGLKSALGLVEGFKVVERKYKDQTIVELVDEADPKSIIYLTVADNLLIATFTGSLMEKAVDQKSSENWTENIKFTEVTNNLGTNKLFRFFFNYSQLNNFASSYMTEPSETLQMLSNSLLYSALNINLQDEMLRFEGFTNIDSLGSYVKAMADVKPGKVSAWKIMSDQTSLYMSMSFDNYMDFYNNLTAQYREGNAEDMEDIEGGIELVEKLLNISVQEHFFDWIGNEIAFVKLNPGRDIRMEDVIVAIHANEIDKAKAGMAHIMKMIKRRTPTKFEDEVYKNYEVFKFDRKDFFKLFFGKLFNSLEKPYFTYIEDYVVMSNSLPALKNAIDDYVVGSTLARKQDFMDFKDEFNPKGNITLFVRTPKMYENLFFYSTPEDRKSLKENKEFILSFSNIGFQLVSKGSIFDTQFLAKHDPSAIGTDELETFEKEVTEDLFQTEIDSLRFRVEIPAPMLATEQYYKHNYEGTELLKYEGRIEDGALSGVWKTYYESGNIKSSVNYVNGKIEGEAFFYFDNVKRIMLAHALFDDEQIIENYEEFYENGARKALIPYKDGVPHGDAEFYYENGKLKIEAEYKNGFKHGKWKFYDENGELMTKEKWKKGKIK